MDVFDKVRNLSARVRKSKLFGGYVAREVEVNYGKYRNLVKSLRPKAEQVAFSERDPRVDLFLEGGEKNVYVIQFVLSGDGIEDVANNRLLLRAEILRGVTDEFERNEAEKRFEEALEAQQDLLRKKNYYVQMDLAIPEFDFEKKTFEFQFQSLISNRSIALQDVQFIWDQNLTVFDPRFLFRFHSPEEARNWKQNTSGMKLGILFHVVTSSPRLSHTGMPATICYVVGFAFVNGRTGEILDNMPVHVFGLTGPHSLETRNRDQIHDTVTKLLADA